jgi:C1A family cysteine protease
MAAVVFYSLTSFSAAINVQQLNQKLAKTNAEWVAKDNWLNQLPKADLKRMMGLRSVPTAEVEFVSPDNFSTKAGLPDAFDWRNKDGKNWVSPMLNQANCGSCVAFAAVGVMETQLNISSSFAGLNLRLSPQNLFSCGGGACDYGWFPGAAANHLMTKGIPDEACMPYTSGALGQDVSCKNSCADTSSRSHKIASYKTPNRSLTSVASVKQALQKGPVMTTLTVYEDFVAYAGGVYKHVSGSALGGHAISIVGYDDIQGAFVIRNSWGEDWGEKGFGRVSYDDISGVGRQTWGFDIPAMGGAVSIVSPRDYTYVTGSTDFKVQSSYPATNSLSLAVYDASNAAVWSSTCISADCTGIMDSAKLKDGRYEVQATAINAKGDKIDSSTREFFYVVNNKPELQLNFSGLDVDLNKELSDRIEFDITTSTSSVPFSALEFHYKDAAGIEKTRVADVVLNRMTIGWRTNLIPDGAYEIWMVGVLKTNSMNVRVETPHRTVRVKN